MDTTKIVAKGKFPGYFALKPDQPQKELYKILTVKPNDTIHYLALKESSKDYSQYKILNSITPDKLQVNRKKYYRPNNITQTKNYYHGKIYYL